MHLIENSVILVYVENSILIIKIHSNENVHCIEWKWKIGKIPNSNPKRGEFGRNESSYQMPCITFSCIIMKLLLYYLYLLFVMKIEFVFIRITFPLNWAHIFNIIFIRAYIFSISFFNLLASLSIYIFLFIETVQANNKIISICIETFFEIILTLFLL